MEEVKNTVRFAIIPNFPNYCIGEDGRVRIRAIKRGDTIVEGTVFEIKSKYPINVFENESSKEVSK